MGMFNEWEATMELCGLQINLSKTKVLVTGKRGSPIESGRYPCGVSGRGVGSNSIISNTCWKWCHKPCSGLAIPTCVAGPRVVTVVADDSVAAADGAILDVEQFCYLVDMLNQCGDAERSVRCRIACRWAQRRGLAALFGNHGITIKHRSKVYVAYFRSVVTYSSKAWPLTKKFEDLLIKAAMRMLRYIAGVSLRDRVTNEGLLRTYGLECVSTTLYEKGLVGLAMYVRET